MTAAHLAAVPSPAAPGEAERFHRLRALAKLWGVSEGLLRKEIAARRLSCHRVGKTVIISEADAQSYLAARRVEARR